MPPGSIPAGGSVQPVNISGGPMTVNTLNGLNTINTGVNNPRIIRLQSTPGTLNVLNSPSSPLPKVQRRQSLQPTISNPTIIKSSLLSTHTTVPQKSDVRPISSSPIIHAATSATHHADAIRKIEADITLTEREKRIKIRQEWKRRNDLIREAAEIKRDETFQKYRAAKVKGRPHPDPVIESMALATVPVPDVTMNFKFSNRIIGKRDKYYENLFSFVSLYCTIVYNLEITNRLKVEGKLSDLQLEAVIYAKQQHAQYYPSGDRKGFLLGDGAGVGKGRTIAGIIADNWAEGRHKAVWFSVSNDLRQDAQRDLRDIGCGDVKIHAFHKFKYGAKISDKENNSVKDGVIFGTYASLIGERHHDRMKTTKTGKVLKTNQSTRLHQLLTWCGTKFDGLIIFDECHKAKNLYQANGKPSKTGHTVLELQKSLKHARIVYASATGASEPKHMSYMNRIGLWGAGTGFRNSDQFRVIISKHSYIRPFLL